MTMPQDEALIAELTAALYTLHECALNHEPELGDDHIPNANFDAACERARGVLRKAQARQRKLMASVLINARRSVDHEGNVVVAATLLDQLTNVLMEEPL